MYKREYEPLLENGFKQIALWQLDKVFLEPFEENEQRQYLINRLSAYISEVLSLGLNAELWIDGSFSTYKPEPQDVDVVFLLDENEIEHLSDRKQKLFEELFLNREIIKARYSVDVYFIDQNDEIEKQKWIATYGFDSRKINSKGIYKIQLPKDV
ncbi:DUF6932 family protein [Flavobacterium laiguense]|uniref:Polymerase nucleotidyl transferase domain-containing protein n=1 Tax=Flavobacterium laiguense TaxID=2169409 RepID=A0A2U1JQU4_9FLAO|nr:hypothetical protein [Flavobacterium laiguense]PWA07550.1 hypothetical protein DB891_14455 [Flavobacterium laiguense]